MIAHWVAPQQSLIIAIPVFAMVGLFGGRGGGGGSAFFSAGVPVAIRTEGY